MLANVDWLIPLVEAQVQYRLAYYGMTAAALLEDVFFDCLSNYVARHRADTEVEKTTRGDRHGDYLIAGLEISHKNVQGPTAIAAHWDATVPVAGSWTSLTPMLVVSSTYSRVQGSLSDGASQPVGVVRVAFPPGNSAPPGKVLALTRWSRDGKVEVIKTYDEAPVPWTTVWPDVSVLLDSGVPANESEVVFIPRAIPQNFSGSMEIAVRPGIYLFPKQWLANIDVTRNNRSGNLIPRATVEYLMLRAVSEGLWTPLPTWPAGYAAPRPPDLYLAQRAVLDRRFSPVRGGDA
jgi:hypothetical protein